MYNNIPTKVLTCEVRLSYVNLVQPRVNSKDPNAEPKYGATLLIPKTETATYQNILSSIEAAAQEAQGKLWNGVRPPVMPIPIHDGDGVRDNGTPFGEECRGCWVITANTKQKPQVVHQNDINTELLPQDIYSGMYARVTINFFGYNQMGKRGIGCGLGNVMKTRDGDPLSGGASAAADFAGIGQEIVVPAPAQSYGAAPIQNYGYANPVPAQPMGYGAVPVSTPAPAPSQPVGYTAPAQPQINPVTGQPQINPVTGQPYYG